MVAHQLDLFGGPLKPPKKIKVDDDISADVQAPVVEQISTAEESEAPETVAADLLMEDSPINETIISNDAEWTPETANGAEETAVYEPPVEEDETVNTPVESIDEPNNILEPDLASTEESAITPPDGWREDEDEPAFTNEAIFAPEIENIDEPVEAPAEEIAQEPIGSLEVADEPVDQPLHPETITTQSINEVPAEPMAETIEEPTEESEEPVSLTEVEIADEPTSVEASPATITRRKGTHEHEEEDGLNVPPDEELFKRQYYSMRETSAMFGVNQSLLRFWENEFDILQPKKNKKGDRYFRPVDIKNLVLIYHLLRVRKFTMDGAKEYLQTHKKAGDTFEMIKRLEKLKSFLLELKAGL